MKQNLIDHKFKLEGETGYDNVLTKMAFSIVILTAAFLV